MSDTLTTEQAGANARFDRLVETAGAAVRDAFDDAYKQIADLTREKRHLEAERDRRARLQADALAPDGDVVAEAHSAAVAAAAALYQPPGHAVTLVHSVTTAVEAALEVLRKQLAEAPF